MLQVYHSCTHSGCKLKMVSCWRIQINPCKSALLIFGTLMSKIIEKSLQMPGTSWYSKTTDKGELTLWRLSVLRLLNTLNFKLLFVDFVEREIANPLRILLGSATSKQTTARSSKTNYLSNLVITFILKQQCDVREAWQGKPHAKTRSDVFWAYRSATPADGMLFL